MATYDETVGSANIGWNQKANSGAFMIQEELVVATAIANHATPTTNGYFTIADVIQLMDYPAGCLFFFSVHRTVTAGTTAGGTCDLGEAGGQTFDSAVAIDATAGTVVVGTVTAGSEDDFYSAANTADWEVLSQNLLTGSYVWSLLGQFGS